MEYFILVIIFFALLFDKLNIFLFLLISSLLHEIGHIAACLLCGCKPKIKISVFGIKLSRYPEKIYKKALVIICGPLVNLVAFLVCAAMISQKFTLDLYIFMLINLIILIFNCMPVFFMDGGQLVALFCQNYILRNILDILSLIVIIIIVLLLSENIIVSLVSLTLFLLYYYMNKKTAF